ncbi:sensor domain-containing diguanylate cyclase [Azohydromonas aeria]|uniref:sensor domain-containing diguanylate cyclase n=1 Tax=Azohydromonas aeria TaxID=2590212 RepID=UPI0012FC3A9B|nr:diguanylate cyclase [Azohydromonas aeria]
MASITGNIMSLAWRPTRLRWRTSTAVWACLALVAAALVFEWQSYSAAMAQAQRDSRNLSASVLRHTMAFMRQADIVIGMVVRLHEGAALDTGARTGLREVIIAQAGAQPGIEDVYVYGADGTLAASSWAQGRYEASALGREYFGFHRATARDVLHLGKPYRAEHDGQWVLPVSRRLSTSDGGFAGIVVVAMRASHLSEHYAQLDLGPDALVALITREGMVLTRHPFVEKAMGMSLRDTAMYRDHYARSEQGTFIATSPVDGIERIASFKHSSDFPVMAVVGLSKAHALAAWWQAALVNMAIVGVLVALLGWGGWRHQRLLRQQQGTLGSLAAANRRLADLEKAIDEHAVVAVTDVKGRIVHANDKFCALSKYTLPELLGANHRVLKSERHDKDFWRAMWRTVARGGVWQGEVCNRAKDGSEYWVNATVVPFLDERGRPVQYIAIRSDITARKQAEEQLRQAHERLSDANASLARLAAFDALTGLPNRRQFDETFAKEHRRAQRLGGPMAMLMVDVDHFKQFNDTYGHATGDECLKAVAQATQGVQRRPGDLAARWGGEEFVVLLPHTDAEGALVVAERLREAVQARAIAHRGSPLGHVSVSVGVHAVQPLRGSSMAELMNGADQALYQAKHAGRNRVQLLAVAQEDAPSGVQILKVAGLKPRAVQPAPRPVAVSLSSEALLAS